MIKASRLCEVLTIKLRGINYQVAHLVSTKKDHVVRRDGLNHVRDSIWRRHLPILFGGRMAEWLRPADCEVLTIKLRGINYQFAHHVFQKKTIWYVASVSITSAFLYGAGICRYL